MAESGVMCEASTSQWPALLSYFRSHEDAEKKGSRVHRCAESVADPVMHLMFHFLAFILAPLNNFNTMFQAGDSMIAFLHVEMERLMKLFMAEFVKMTTISESDHITTVDYKISEHQHDDNLLAVGIEARRYISENEDAISPAQLSTFFRGVRSFYVEVTEKMLAKFPFGNETLVTLGYINPNSKKAADVQSVEKLARRLGVADDGNSEQLTSEIHDYLLTEDKQFPPFNQEATEENPDVTPLECW